MGTSTFITVLNDGSEYHPRTVARQLQNHFAEPATGGIGKGEIRPSLAHKGGHTFEVASQEIEAAMQIVETALENLEILEAIVESDPTFIKGSESIKPLSHGVLITLKAA